MSTSSRASFHVTQRHWRRSSRCASLAAHDSPYERRTHHVSVLEVLRLRSSQAESRPFHHIVPSSYTINQQASSDGCMQGVRSASVRTDAVLRLLTHTLWWGQVSK